MVYSLFTKYAIYPILELYNKENVLRHFEQLKKTQWLTAEKIRKIQWKKLRNLLEYATTNVPFYHQLFKTLSIRPKDIVTPKDFRKVPLLAKEDIINNISYIVSSNYQKKDLIPNSTGGSTGVNLNFFSDRKNSGYVKAVVLRNDCWAGLELGDKKAFLWGSPFDISFQDKLKAKIHNKMFRTIPLSSYDLSEEKMFVYAKKLLEFRPKAIIGYPSPLFHFARFLKGKGINGINPKLVISSAEVLYDYQKELIQSVFQCKVFNRYGCREFSTIAQECFQHLGMHINAEHVYVECLKGDGEPAAPGEKGELVITNLDNYAMPFIRYRISDIGALSDEICECGRGLPLLEKVEGRTFDVIVGTNGRAVGGTFWTILLRTVIKGIKQFRVIQESLSEVNIEAVLGELFEERQVDMLINKIREYLGKDMEINFQIVDEIPPTKSGKSRLVISKVANSWT